jgi:hypothetical protein
LKWKWVLIERIQIIGAPAFFPTVWGWIKKWFDPITTSKIFILSSSDLKKTLESFIEPVNIPKKYGGQLEFQFGDMPVLDPHLSKVLKWEEGRSDFPRGPMFWKTDGEEAIKAIAVGSTEGGKERREDVCVVKKELPPLASESSTSEPVKAETANGHLAAPGAGVATLRPELLTAPTETDLPSTIHEPTPTTALEPEPKSEETKEKVEEKKEVQEGELVPPTRPEPQTFVTAHEGVETLKDLSLDEKSNGGGPHQTMTANLLDPNLHVGEGVGEKAAA